MTTSSNKFLLSKSKSRFILSPSRHDEEVIGELERWWDETVAGHPTFEMEKKEYTAFYHRLIAGFNDSINEETCIKINRITTNEALGIANDDQPHCRS